MKKLYFLFKSFSMDVATEELDALFRHCKSPKQLIALYGVNSRFRDIIKRIFCEVAKKPFLECVHIYLALLTIQPIKSIGLEKEIVVYKKERHKPYVIIPRHTATFISKDLYRICSRNIKTQSYFVGGFLYDEKEDKFIDSCLPGRISNNVALHYIKTTDGKRLCGNKKGNYLFFITQKGELFLAEKYPKSDIVYRINITTAESVDEFSKILQEQKKYGLYLFMCKSTVICFKHIKANEIDRCSGSAFYVQDEEFPFH